MGAWLLNYNDRRLFRLWVPVRLVQSVLLPLTFDSIILKVKKLGGMWLRNARLKLEPYNILMFYDYGYLDWLTLRNCDVIGVNVSGFEPLNSQVICSVIIDHK